MAGVIRGEPLVFDVNTEVDSVDAIPGDGDCADANGACSLRAAIMEANVLPGRQRIELAAGTYALSLEGAGENAAASGDLDILDDLDLIGAGAMATVIDADGIDRAIDIGPAGEAAPAVRIAAVGITGGRRRFPGLSFVEARGGGIRIGRQAALELDDSRVAGNEAGLMGAGIVNYGHLVVRRCTIEDNHDGDWNGGTGGGLATGDNAAASAHVLDSVIRNNEAMSRGGGAATIRDGVLDFGTLTIERSAIVGNRSNSGGGFYADASGLFVLDSSTVSGNQRSGLFIDNFCDTWVRFSTIAGNVSPGVGVGGAYVNVHGASNPHLHFEGSLIADNVPNDCFGPARTLGHNLIQVPACLLANTEPSDLIGVPALLGPLQGADGSPPFHALEAGSPALDAAGAGCPELDQLGQSRPVDGDGDGKVLCDIGAIEQPDQGTGFDLIFFDGFEIAG